MWAMWLVRDAMSFEVDFWIYSDVGDVTSVRQEMASSVTVGTSFSAHKHLNTWVPARSDNTLSKLSVMHHVMSTSLLLLHTTVCVFVCLFSSRSSLVFSCEFQEAAFRTAWWVSWQDPPPLTVPTGRQWEVSHRALRGVCVCVSVVMRGIYWGRSGLPFRKLQIYPSSREALLWVCVCWCFCVC